MKFSKADAMTFIRKEAIAIFFIAVVFASFIFHAAHRNEHFQEDDSWAVQQIVSDTRAIEAGLLEKLRTFEPRQGSIRDGLVQMRLVARSSFCLTIFHMLKGRLWRSRLPRHTRRDRDLFMVL